MKTFNVTYQSLKNKYVFNKTVICIFISSLLFLSGQVAAQCGDCNADPGLTRYGYKTGTNGTQSSFFGNDSGETNTGTYNTFIGSQTGRANTSGKQNTFLGYGAGRYNVSGSFNTFLGYRSGHNTTSNYNTYIGFNSGYSNKTGINNTVIGVNSGYSATSSNNTLIGTNSGRHLSTGSGNIIVGFGSGFNISKGIQNVFIGTESGYNNSGNSNVFLGQYSGYNESGSGKLCIANSKTKNLIYGDFTTGSVGINTNSIPAGYTLSVNGSILAVGLEIQPYGDWPDYVFGNDYSLMPLNDLAVYVEKKHHLPGVPSEAEIQKEGLNVAEMDAILLKKVEEFTLYLIGQDKKIQEQAQHIQQLQAQLDNQQ